MVYDLGVAKMRVHLERDCNAPQTQTEKQKLGCC